MSRLRPYTPKRPEGRFKYVPGLAGFEAMVHAVVCHQVAGARLAPARATPTWPGSRLDDRTICCGDVCRGQSRTSCGRRIKRRAWPARSTRRSSSPLVVPARRPRRWLEPCRALFDECVTGNRLRCTATRPNPSTRISSRVGRWRQGLAGRRSSRSARRGSVPRRTVERAQSGGSARKPAAA
jgi:hypothetical protein